MENSRKWIYAVAAMILFQVITTTRVFPRYMAYTNELWGGPSQTYKYLSDSNVDWGQQLKSTKDLPGAEGNPGVLWHPVRAARDNWHALAG